METNIGSYSSKSKDFELELILVTRNI